MRFNKKTHQKIMTVRTDLKKEEYEKIFRKHNIRRFGPAVGIPKSKYIADMMNEGIEEFLDICCSDAQLAKCQKYIKDHYTSHYYLIKTDRFEWFKK